MCEGVFLLFFDKQGACHDGGRGNLTQFTGGENNLAMKECVSRAEDIHSFVAKFLRAKVYFFRLSARPAASAFFVLYFFVFFLLFLCV